MLAAAITDSGHSFFRCYKMDAYISSLLRTTFNCQHTGVARFIGC